MSAATEVALGVYRLGSDRVNFYYVADESGFLGNLFSKVAGMFSSK